jgi:hypothetical protein
LYGGVDWSSQQPIELPQAQVTPRPLQLGAQDGGRRRDVFVACGRYLVYVRNEHSPRVTNSVAYLNSPDLPNFLSLPRQSCKHLSTHCENDCKVGHSDIRTRHEQRDFKKSRESHRDLVPDTSARRSFQLPDRHFAVDCPLKLLASIRNERRRASSRSPC